MSTRRPIGDDHERRDSGDVGLGRYREAFPADVSEVTPLRLLHPSAAPQARPARSRRVGRAAAVLALGLATVGCTVDNTPSAYDDRVQNNFLASCTGNLPNVTSTSTLSSPDFCRCYYDVIVKGVPYDDDARASVPGYPEDKSTFRDLESKLKDDPAAINTAVPENVRKGIDDCKAQATVGPRTESPGTTAATGVAPGSTQPTTPGSTPGTGA